MINNDRIFNIDNSRILVLPYHENLLSLRSTLKKMNIKLVFKYNNVIKNNLIKNKPNNNCNGVYAIPCKDCNSIYIGNTGKDLETRIKQHKYSIRRNDNNSSIFLHVQNYDHCIDWNNSEILVFCNDYEERTILESCLIHGSYQKNMNHMKGQFKCDDILSQSVNTNILSNINNPKILFNFI